MKPLRLGTFFARAGVIALGITLVATFGAGYGVAAAPSSSGQPRSGGSSSAPGQHEQPRQQGGATITSTGLAPGSIKHVWLIILENKSYDATFTGLNDNSYLWKTLPAQGALLTHYYGTGHSSMDNYLSLVSGQAPSEDVQSDCATTDRSTATGPRPRRSTNRPTAGPTATRTTS